jgi:hypothetical protein
MLHSFSPEARFALSALSVWRLTHLIVAEDGPWEVVVRLRARLGDSEAGRVMDCFYCASLWLALPFACSLAQGVLSGILILLALSGVAALLEQATTASPPDKETSP